MIMPYAQGGTIVSLTEQGTQLTISGSLKNINTALTSLRLSRLGGKKCNAQLTVNDGLNEVQSESINNLPAYLRENRAPQLNTGVSPLLQQQYE